MKKILIIIGSLKIGGAEKICSDLIINMVNFNLKYNFLVFGIDKGEYEDTLEKIGCNIIHIDKPRFPYFNYYQKLKKINNEFGPFDVIHSHTLLNNGINLMFFHWLGVKKLISHSHSTNSNRKETIVVKLYEKIMKLLICKYATDYLACGQEAGEYLYGNKFKKQGTIIYNGVDFDKFKFNINDRIMLREKYRLKNKFVIGNISRLVKLKNHIFLLDIFNKLLEFNKDCKLVLIGDGGFRNEIEKHMEKLGIEDHVIMLGNREDVHKLQNMLDVIVFPSLYEGLPLSLVEAQINNLPCVLSDTITKEIKISECCDFVPLNEKLNYWCRIILKYYNAQNNRYINSLTNKAKKYNIKKSAKQLENIYLEDDS